MVYTVFESAEIRPDAKKICEANGGTLASFVTQDDIQLLLAATNYSANAYWIGLKYSSVDGKWRFDDGANITFAMTKFSPPQNASLGRCVVMESNGTLRGTLCRTVAQSFICQSSQYFPSLLRSGQKYKTYF